CVIQRSVKGLQLRLIATRHLDLIQLFVPRASSIFANSFKIPVVKLRLEVLPGAFNTDRGDTHFHKYLVRQIEAKRRLYVWTFQRSCDSSLKRSRELSNKIDNLVPGPGTRSPETLDVLFVNYLQKGVEHAITMREIENHISNVCVIRE